MARSAPATRSRLITRGIRARRRLGMMSPRRGTERRIPTRAPALSLTCGAMSPRIRHDRPGALAGEGVRLMGSSRVQIEYCTQCRWLLRAAWMAQELLTTFEGHLGEVALVPGTGGVFVVRVDGELVWD